MVASKYAKSTLINTTQQQKRKKNVSVSLCCILVDANKQHCSV